MFLLKTQHDILLETMFTLSYYMVCLIVEQKNSSMHSFLKK